MDIASTVGATTATATAAITAPEAKTETTTRILSTKPLSFSNGVLKRTQPLHHHHLNAPPVLVTYRECLKNHAASLGGHAVDGCGEFMPSTTATPTDPTSLKCAACGCHRNFHRREPDENYPATNPSPAQHVIEYQPHHRHHPPPPPRGRGANSSSPNSPSPPPISSSYYPSAPHMLLALSAGAVSSGPPPENHHPSLPSTPGSAGAATASNPSGRKRFRTKFTPNQKERMQEFAERVGWKMQKRDEELIAGFCNEIGVDKTVFKVWMHNNKSIFGKRENSTNNNNGSAGGGIDFSRNNIDSSNHDHHQHHNHHNDDGNHHSNNNDSVSTGHVITTNGSSSSS